MIIVYNQSKIYCVSMKDSRVIYCHKKGVCQYIHFGRKNMLLTKTKFKNFIHKNKISSFCQGQRFTNLILTFFLIEQVI